VSREFMKKEDLKAKALEKSKALAGKGKGFFGEFKEFILRGNVVDMAIGVIIGSAFSALITEFTKDFINPLINGIGGVEVGGTIKIYGGQELLWGNFVTAVINFVIIAFVLFMMLKVMNKLLSIRDKKEEKEDKKEEAQANRQEELLEAILAELKKRK
jgi:large conductance mechanosensitive channel